MKEFWIGCIVGAQVAILIMAILIFNSTTVSATAAGTLGARADVAGSLTLNNPAN